MYRESLSVIGLVRIGYHLTALQFDKSFLCFLFASAIADQFSTLRYDLVPLVIRVFPDHRMLSPFKIAFRLCPGSFLVFGALCPERLPYLLVTVNDQL